MKKIIDCGTCTNKRIKATFWKRLSFYELLKLIAVPFLKRRIKKNKSYLIKKSCLHS